MTQPTPYDVVIYPGRTYRETHPDRLATSAALYGMTPAPPARCRVFEIGCGLGNNLIPMAYQYPDSQFLGIDLSARSIERGLSTIAALGLKNIELRHCDIMDISVAHGHFDYVIAHGIYSWVPDPVRDKMMAIFKENLAPQGVAYVSYNCYPGSHPRNLVRDMMNFHVRETTDPQERVKQARAILNFFAETAPKESAHGAMLRDQRERVRGMGDEVIFHDDLDVGSKAFLLHEVVAAAGRHRLQYLCDATMHRRALLNYPDLARTIFEKFPENDFMVRDQYHDFVDGHGFRRTLLCHDDVCLDRKVDSSCMRRFHVASSLVPVAENFRLEEPGTAEFKLPNGNLLATDHLLSKAAIVHLERCWPAAIGFSELVENASRMAASVAGAPPQPSEHDVATLAAVLYRAVSNGLMDLFLYPPRLAIVPSERPVASLIARRQIEAEQPLTNLRHQTVLFKDDIARQFLMLVDGTRNADQLVVDLSDRLAQTGLLPKDKAVTRADVEYHLKTLARLGLLIQ
jgi:SAM-dependent methyltransferase